MSSTVPGVAADIDLDAPGFRTGYVKVTHSDDRHAFAVIPVPIAVLVGDRPGPTMFLSAGNHGDEYEGQALLHRALRTRDPHTLRGRLIVMPALNLPAVRAARRVSPIDGGNMNRVFPGDPRSGPTGAIAAWVTAEVLSRANFACDLHSGGSSGRYIPCAYLHWGGDAAFRRRKIAAARAFGAPYTVIAAAAGASGSMTAESDRRGVLMVATEFGGAGGLDRATTALAQACLDRLLAHAGIAEDAPAATGGATGGATRFIVLHPPGDAPMAECAGVFEPAVGMGEVVATGDLAGTIWPVTGLSQPGVEIRFGKGGLIVAERHRPLVEPGDLLFRLGAEIDPEAIV